ncbi:MAG: MerR family transcriptional regulator [Pseudomonadota bacterium]
MQIDHDLLATLDSAETDPSITITTLTRDLGTTPRALRFYEEKGLLVPRRHRGRRTYGPSDQARARLIVELRAIDVAVTEIESILRDLLTAAPEARADILKAVVVEQIARLEDTRERVATMLEEAAAVRASLDAMKNSKAA